MKTDKEYPATHSMSTSWYVVDDEGNGLSGSRENIDITTEMIKHNL